MLIDYRYVDVLRVAETPRKWGLDGSFESGARVGRGAMSPRLSAPCARGKQRRFPMEERTSDESIWETQLRFGGRARRQGQWMN